MFGLAAAELLERLLRDEELPPRLAALFDAELAALLPLADEPPLDPLLRLADEELLLRDPDLEAALLDAALDLLLFEAPPRLAPEERPPFAATLFLVDLLADAKPRLELFDPPLEVLLFDDLEDLEDLLPALLLRAAAFFDLPPRALEALLLRDALLRLAAFFEGAPFEELLLEDLEDLEDFDELLRLADPLDEELFDLLPEDLLADFFVAFAMFNGFCEEIIFSFEITMI